MSTPTLVFIGFIVLPLAMALLVSWTARSKGLALCILAWMVFAAALARSGMLMRFSSVPPPMALFLVGGLVATVVAGRSRWVNRLVELPMAALIGAQAFRILVEILIHQSSSIGLAPPQMTWEGNNFDIVTGVTALALAPFARVVPGWVIVVWNCLGLTLLIVVIGIAALSFPTPFQRMHPDNTWVAEFPYVWLPSVLVPIALLGHIVTFRKMATRQPREGSSV